jgi:hypothetical protein
MSNPKMIMKMRTFQWLRKLFCMTQPFSILVVIALWGLLLPASQQVVFAESSKSLLYPSGTWRYKMTVSVETPEGIKTGFAVREVTVELVPKLTPEMKPTTRIKGEAVVVDLGQRGVVFALLVGNTLGTDHAKFLPFHVFPFGKEPLSKEGIVYYRNLKAGPTDIDLQLLPTLVRFRNQSDPKTIENLIEVDVCPGHRGWPKVYCLKKDRFEEALGEGVQFKSATIEMTEESVTADVEKYLPWLPDYYNKMLDGQRYNKRGAQYPLANSLASGAFSVGVIKRGQ